MVGTPGTCDCSLIANDKVILTGDVLFQKQKQCVFGGKEIRAGQSSNPCPL